MIRVVPHVEREEFINVGIVLLCTSRKFLSTKIELDEQRLLALSNGIEVQELRDHINSFERICKGGNDGGPIGKLTIAERFRWLTSARSTVLQTSKVHPGLCTDPADELTKLFNQLVRKI